MSEEGAGRLHDAEVVLTGGTMSVVPRRGDAVHRTSGPWTPTIHRLLDHLHARGTDFLPRPLGMDDEGREVLTFLPGAVPMYPLPPWVWTDEVLRTAGGWLACVHAASADFDITGATWQLACHEPAEVICLNDVAPYNMVFDEAGRLRGWIDVDVSSPGPRGWDLAHLAYRLVPLSGAAHTGAATRDLLRCRDRLASLCEAYAGAGDEVLVAPGEVVATAVTRLVDLARFTADRAAAGAQQVASHVALDERDAAWIGGARGHAVRQVRLNPAVCASVRRTSTPGRRGQTLHWPARRPQERPACRREPSA